jgi:hypothetical protein
MIFMTTGKGGFASRLPMREKMGIPGPGGN